MAAEALPRAYRDSRQTLHPNATDGDAQTIPSYYYRATFRIRGHFDFWKSTQVRVFFWLPVVPYFGLRHRSTHPPKCAPISHPRFVIHLLCLTGVSRDLLTAADLYASVTVLPTMRVLPFLAVLPALAAAQEQTPLVERVQGWFNKAKSYLPSPTPVAPVEKVTGQIAQKAVTPFNLSNWHSLLEPSSEPQEWLVFVTGGNKTCFGRCGRAEKAFNVGKLKSA